MREVELILTKRLIKDLIYKYNILNGGKYFSLWESKKYFVFQPLSSYFTTFKSFKIASWRSKGMLVSSIKPPFTIDNSFDPEITYNYGQKSVKF